jgi:hypothetical protein
VGTDITIAASAIVVLTALVALVRAIGRMVIAFRDNAVATRANTAKLDDLTVSIDGRFDALAERVARLEGRREARITGRQP